MSKGLKRKTVSRLKILKQIVYLDVLCKDKELLINIIDTVLLELEE